MSGKLPTLTGPEVIRALERGGFEVDLDWTEGLLRRAVVRSRLGGVCRVRAHAPCRVGGGVAARAAAGPNPNPFYPDLKPAPPVIADNLQVRKLEMAPGVVTEFRSERGREYVLTF